jgi:hypothetical protein
MVLAVSNGTSELNDPESGRPVQAMQIISKIEDTLELYPEEAATATASTSKAKRWHEKFARNRKP